jgi:hypothetical protein
MKYSLLFKRAVTTAALTSLTAISACSTWVTLAPGAEQVAVKLASEVAACERIGSASAKSLSKLAFVDRNSTKVQQELNTLARNEAVLMKGNAVLAESGILEGQQKFGVYRCP